MVWLSLLTDFFKINYLSFGCNLVSYMYPPRCTLFTHYYITLEPSCVHYRERKRERDKKRKNVVFFGFALEKSAPLTPFSSCPIPTPDAGFSPSPTSYRLRFFPLEVVCVCVCIFFYKPLSQFFHYTFTAVLTFILVFVLFRVCFSSFCI